MIVNYVSINYFTEEFFSKAIDGLYALIAKVSEYASSLIERLRSSMTPSSKHFIKNEVELKLEITNFALNELKDQNITLTSPSDKSNEIFQSQGDGQLFGYSEETNPKIFDQPVSSFIERGEFEEIEL
ncbi:hypothetical protein [Candidatus Neptunochlamydia vexilliferae]|uniref:Uncharacterized protein n=1 Tax=Candidatus Neptunichlamydia vexilliferae TaxID=1651774 RepID=A0ABS0B216_9BACT|nr:hypothetical protein [Candidatus Neptunochlamydia vexilliferae]MBF5059766.1 hypothetical protein [Candidatus Neptunochlamydia vexilliferae]